MAAKTSLSTGGQVFVDESKATDYLLIGTVVVPGQLVTARRVVRNLILPGQRRIHMKRESDRRRRTILAAIRAAGFTSIIFRAADRNISEVVRRGICIDALVDDALKNKRNELIFELDASLERRDHNRIAARLKAANAPNDLAYRHDTPGAEPVLAIPDAVGWAWARGGDWRRRVDVVVVNVNGQLGP